MPAMVLKRLKTSRALPLGRAIDENAPEL